MTVLMNVRWRWLMRGGADIADAVSGGPLLPTLDPRIVRGIGVARDHFNDPAFGALRVLTAAQVDSIRQRRKGTPVDEIRDITRRKGAYTILLFALEVSPDMAPERRAGYEELGYLVQLLDDFTDRFLDRAEGITTLMNLSLDMSQPMLLIQRQARKVKMLFAREYSPGNLVELFSYIDRSLAGVGLLN